MHTKRIGIYGNVPKDSDAIKIISSILGYDPFLIAHVKQDQIIAPFCGRANKFGSHFTLYDIFSPTDYQQVIVRVKEIVRDTSPFHYSFSGFSGYVRGDYQGKSIYNDTSKTVLALDFDENDIKKINQIHFDVVQGIQDLRMKIEPEFDKKIFQKVPELWENIQNFGAPYVLDHYSPHLTLASKLDGSEETLSKLIKHLDTKYGDRIIGQKIPFDRIYVYEEILSGKFSGHFYIKEEIPLIPIVRKG